MGDFGLAANLKATNDARHTLCGTSWYMAPETLEGNMVMKSDIWSLGVSLIELADKQNPFSSCREIKDVWELQKYPITLSENWSPEFRDFISKCLVRDVKERWNVDQLLDVGLLLESDG